MAALLLAGCSSDEPEGVNYQVGDPVEDPEIAAIVTSEFGADTLYVGTFQAQRAQMGAPPNQVIEAFIARHVLRGEADRLNLNVDEERVEQHMETLRGRFGDEDEYRAALEQEGMTEASLREAVVQSLRMQEMEQELTASVEEPTDDEVSSYRSEQARHIEAQHILFRVPTEADDDERSAIRQRGEAVLDSIKAGADFAEMARRHGEDGTAENGGQLGMITRGQTVPPFEDALFALADSGDVTSNLVETDFGYHIIRKTGERELDVMSEQHARTMIVQERRQEALQGELDRLMAKATVRVNPEVAGTDLRQQ